MTLTESLTYNACRQTSYLQFLGSTIHCSILNLLFNYTYFNMAIPFPSLTLKSTRTTSYSKKNYLTLFIFCRGSIVSVIFSGEQYIIRSSLGKPKLTLHHFSSSNRGKLFQWTSAASNFYAADLPFFSCFLQQGRTLIGPAIPKNGKPNWAAPIS